jgi:DNA-binding CsgD family transcriptional regulator
MLATISIISMRPSKNLQIAQRRIKVLELYSRGYTQQEIADKMEGFHISRQTIGSDLKVLREESDEYVQNFKQTLSFDYRQVESNLHQLLKRAWGLMEQAEAEKDKELQRDMFGIIQSLNADILELKTIADVIKQDRLKELKESAAENEKKMDEVIIEQNHVYENSKSV